MSQATPGQTGAKGGRPVDPSAAAAAPARPSIVADRIKRIKLSPSVAARPLKITCLAPVLTMMRATG